MTTTQKLLRFGVFEMNLSTEEIRKGGTLLKLPPQPFRVLALLASRSGQIVTREEIQKQIWGEETYVDFEQGLNHCIKQIRSVLNDNADSPLYVETVPRRGYRFLAPVISKTIPAPPPRVTESKSGIQSGVIPTPSSIQSAPGTSKPPTSIATPVSEAKPPQAPVQVPVTPAPLVQPRAEERSVIQPAIVVEPPQEPPKAGPRWIWLVLALAILVVGVVAYFLWASKGLSGGKTGSGSKQRRSVAVLGFKNATDRPDSAWLSTAISEMLSTELAAGDELRIIPGENVARLKMETHLSDTDALAPDTLKKIRKMLGADYVVLGSYTDLGQNTGGQIRLDLRLQDAVAGETIASISQTGTEAQLFDLISRTGSSLRPKLGAEEVSTEEAGGVRATLPSNTDTEKLYSQGLEKLRVLDAAAARDFLQQAVAAEPSYALAHSALADALVALGYDKKAREEAEKAFQAATNLPRQDRMLVEARFREINGEWKQAVGLHQMLWRNAPDNVEYGLRLANAQTRANKGKDAMATVAELRALAAPARDDPRIDLAEAAAAFSLGNFKLEQASAEKAAAKAQALGSGLVLARAEREQAKALFYQDKLADALKIYRHALITSQEQGDLMTVASSLNNIADVLQEQGQLAEAQTMYRQALETYRNIGNERSAAGTLSNMGVVYQLQGDMASARNMYEQALTNYRELSDQRNQGIVLNNIGEVLYQQADLAGARKMHEQALAISQQSGDANTTAEALFDLGQVLAAQGDLAAARARQQEALKTREAAGQSGLGADSRLALAQLSLEEGHPAEAEDPARKAAEEFKKQELPDSQALADKVLAQSLLAQGKTAEAAKVIAAASAMVAKSQNRALRFSVGITSAQVQAATGKPGDQNAAVASLRQILGEAGKDHLVAVQYDATLALGELEMKVGQAASGRARLASLQKEAGARGFGLIARKAAAANRA